MLAPMLRLSTIVSALLLAACAPAPVPDTVPAVFECGAARSAIADIQGSGTVSPVLGQMRDIEAVVTGNFGPGLGGFFVQDPDHDRTDASRGLFVALRERPDGLRSGVRVRVRGRVAEIGPQDASLTALADPVEVRVCGRGAAIAPRVLTAPPQDWEHLEGMRVVLPGPLVVNGNYTLHRFGELLLAFGERTFQPTELYPPGAQARALAADNARRSILVDDARSQENPASLWFLPESVDTLRAGSRVSGVTGIVDQRHGSYRIQLTDVPGAIEAAPRPRQAPVVPGNLRVAAFNVLNYFDGDGAGGGFPTERGAQTAAEFERQAAKIVAAIVALDADIVALAEIENDGYDERSAIADLVRRLQAAPDGGADWRFVPPDGGNSRLGGDAIAVGLIYRASKVSLLGSPAILEGGPFAWGNRVPLAAAFRRVDGGPAVTVAAVHFKSKGSCPEQPGPDSDQGDGQACWNAARVEAARAIDAWLSRDPTDSGTALSIIAGDFNAHSQEDPIRLLRSKGYVDAFSRSVQQGQPYSFVFRGLAGRLDHVLVSPALVPYLAGAAHWHINADEPPVRGYQGSDNRWYRPDPFRSADHDPAIVGLNLPD